jgi:thymidine phosphorylase
MCLAKPGDHVTEGQPVLELHLDDARRLPEAVAALHGAMEIRLEPRAPRPLIIDVIRA